MYGLFVSFMTTALIPVFNWCISKSTTQAWLLVLKSMFLEEFAGPSGPQETALVTKDAVSAASASLKSHFQAAGLGSFPSLQNDKFSTGVGNNATPGQTHHFLKRFLEDSFRFQTASQIYSFLELVCNANTENTSWVEEDGYEHMHKLTKGNGILRLGDVIRFPEGYTQAWSFQRGYVPLLTYFSSEWVIKSTMHNDVNMLYGLLHTNFDIFNNTLKSHMERLMQARSFREPGRRPMSGMHVFKTLFTVLFEYLTRFKNATVANPDVCPLVRQAASWFEAWSQAISTPAGFDDECASYDEELKSFILKNLDRNKSQVISIIERGLTRISKPPKQVASIGAVSSEALIANLQRISEHDGPGELRDKGPRHDNDHISIQDIRIAPTHQELMCEDDPYLPPNFPGAPHFHPHGSVERLLDIQFRLLREELIAPIRMAIQLVVSDLRKPPASETLLSKIIKSKGGRYAAPANVQESVIFSVFTNVSFEPLTLNNRGTSVGVVVDAPPGKARSKQAATRVGYWEQVTKKRLMQGGLVALIWKDSLDRLDIYVGTIASSPRDLVESSRKSEDRVSFRISFFDTAAEIRIVRALQNRRTSSGTQVLIEAPVFFEGIRPFLEALKVDPERLPFARYLCHQSSEELKSVSVAPPSYSLTPQFAFELKDLFPDDAGVSSLALSTTTPESISRARAELRASRLDPSQADAVVDSLTREVCLIQGPPGTGKASIIFISVDFYTNFTFLQSYTGLEIIRVLIKNKVQPILLVAFTNHALDHMLKGVLDAEITNNIIRLGSRHAADDRIMEFSLENAEKLQAKSKMDRTINSAYREMKSTETDMVALMKKLATKEVPQDHLEQSLLADYPFHYDELFSSPPAWIWTLIVQSAESQNDWQTVGETQGDLSILNFWLTGRDLAFLQPPPLLNQQLASSKAPSAPSHNPYNVLSEDAIWGSSSTEGPLNLQQQHHDFVWRFLQEHGLENIPEIPQTNRPIDVLFADHNVWAMSLTERSTLYDAWYMAASESIRQSQVDDFESLRRTHAEALRKFQEIQDQNRVTILRQAHIVGCTTTGAAKVVSLLSVGPLWFLVFLALTTGTRPQGMQPKVMIVEEAGQVLESHILASLVPSVEQVIMIGDPLQLRPNVNSYKLSIDNRTTGPIYRFDLSLMERLSKSGFPMSRLDVQRRMRPEISSLIRNTLYPKLEDHSLVLDYPKVRGMHKNVFFVSHANKEVGGGEDAVSKHNAYELDMIHDLVLHLLKQGCYNSSRDIVILAAYLGQIPKIRKRLQNVVTTVIDERDSELLDQHGIEEEETILVQQVQASSRVLIRTLDNFQGEEGNVIILSLVRNNGTKFDGNVSSLQKVPGARSHIGFLKSDNRTNVGLSRAKHGLYIFGNAPELARGSSMWATVLQELHANESIGTALPISCSQHPDYVQWVDQPGVIPVISPDGGCLRPCDAMLGCGHRCPFKCHADDPNHLATKCQERCLKLCPLSHPCDRKCFECTKGCGDCRFPVRQVTLPCGHLHASAPCYLARLPDKIKCTHSVAKKLPTCEHSAKMPCHQDPSTFFMSLTHVDAVYSVVMIARTTANQDINVRARAIKNVARFALTARARNPAPSLATRAFRNVLGNAFTLNVPPLAAWHVRASHAMRNASTRSLAVILVHLVSFASFTIKDSLLRPLILTVCGEPCAVQTCRMCAREDTLDTIVDLIMQTSLRDLEDDDSLDSMTITLACGHVFTVETLDGITHLGDFYSRNPSTGKWAHAITPETHGESRSRPVCPTCRGDITALRYGRICKSSNLAIMQHNISTKMSKSLSLAEKTLDKASTNLEASINSAINGCESYIPATAESKTKAKDQLDILLRQQPDFPTPLPALDNLTEYHALPSNYAKIWRGVVKNVLTAYGQARQVSTRRDSMAQTYEASLATLFQEEMSSFVLHPERAPRDTEQAALRLARMRIGQPPPRASLRFAIEAFWITIRILLMLAETAEQASKVIRTRDSSVENCGPWIKLAEFFLERAVHDSLVALNLAEVSESWNKAAKCQVVIMQTRFEQIAQRCRSSLEDGTLSPATRSALLQLCDQGYEDAVELRSKVTREYMMRWSPEHRASRTEWIELHFHKPTVPILEGWRDLKRSVNGGTWYSTVTREENRSVMRALMEGADRLSHTGHFYECVNGHPYVIGECGGAMEESRCPECGTRVGGQGHQAVTGNTLSRTFVDLAREERVQESPWEWGPGGR
ncbi:Zinc finger, NF-X1-type [Ceratobasidium sp. AG-Ba]|nr:Zinc finger, NF-X1-type [Ceratobasidium sp. AG-Ba]